MSEPLYETCASCGLVQALPSLPAGTEAACARCDHGLKGSASPRAPADHTATFAAALAALLLYPIAIGMPIMEIERLGAALDELTGA